MPFLIEIVRMKGDEGGGPQLTLSLIFLFYNPKFKLNLLEISVKIDFQ
jgi:hypothetical protein